MEGAKAPKICIHDWVRIIHPDQDWTIDKYLCRNCGKRIDFKLEITLKP
jgi:hypothetical protein